MNDCFIVSFPKESLHYIVGFVGGSYYQNDGGAAEPICLPRDPEWGIYRDGIDGMKAFVFGAKYETHNYNYNFRGMHEHDVPCAVCLVRNRSVVKMFPGKMKNNKWDICSKKNMFYFI